MVGFLGSLERSICAAAGRGALGNDVGVRAVSSREGDEGQQHRADCGTDHRRADVDQGRRMPATHEADEPDRDDEEDCTDWRPDGHRPECATVARSFSWALVAEVGLVREIGRHVCTSIV